MENTYISDNVKIRKGRGNITLILGILSIMTSFVSVGFVLGIVGLVFGLVKSIKAKHIKQNGERKITFGIICSISGIVVSVIFSIIYVKILSG